MSAHYDAVCNMKQDLELTTYIQVILNFVKGIEYKRLCFIVLQVCKKPYTPSVLLIK